MNLNKFNDYRLFKKRRHSSPWQNTIGFKALFRISLCSKSFCRSIEGFPTVFAGHGGQMGVLYNQTVFPFITFSGPESVSDFPQH